MQIQCNGAKSKLICNGTEMTNVMRHGRNAGCGIKNKEGIFLYHCFILHAGSLRLGMPKRHKLSLTEVPSPIQELEVGPHSSIA